MGLLLLLLLHATSSKSSWEPKIKQKEELKNVTGSSSNKLNLKLKKPNRFEIIKTNVRKQSPVKEHISFMFILQTIELFKFR